ncbi:MAG: hypothetical protein LBR11_07695, partial [Deltaproteobacteria bacterium]|nr:hypothetical protein [Deltaproteobacteria bacterium]
MKDQLLIEAVESFLARTTKDEPDPIMRWTIKSSRDIAKELAKSGQLISHPHEGKVLKSLGYSLQLNNNDYKNFKSRELTVQFKLINSLAKKANIEKQSRIYINSFMNNSGRQTVGPVPLPWNFQDGWRGGDYTASFKVPSRRARTSCSDSSVNSTMVSIVCPLANIFKATFRAFLS